jgi:hypothetical protein
MVAIEDSSTTEMSRIAAESATRDLPRKYHTWLERGTPSPTRFFAANPLVTDFASPFVGEKLAPPSSVPPSKTSPLTRAPAGSNPINASDNIVFPLPDSPTNPTHSPSPIRSDTSFTGRTHPAAVGNCTVSGLMLNRLVISKS